MDFKFNKNNLNFRVYSAAEEPENGEENDIVIITDVPMSNWVLSPDRPTGVPRTDGDVWIQYSVSGVTFNALKQNSMLISTVSAWQYIGGWVDVTAKTYKNNEWVDWWAGEVYISYNPYKGVPGGWWNNPNVYFDKSVEYLNVDHDLATAFADNKIKLTGPTSKSANVTTVNPVDLTKYTTLQCTGVKWLGGDKTDIVFIHPQKDGNVYENSRFDADGDGTVDVFACGTDNPTINVSKLSGLYYITVLAINGRSFEIDDIILY